MELQKEEKSPTLDENEAITILLKMVAGKKMDINIAIRNAILSWQNQQHDKRARDEGPLSWPRNYLLRPGHILKNLNY